MTDMWDIKFGDDGPNDPAKDLSYRAIANKYGSKYNGEFRVPEQCDDCNQEEDKQKSEQTADALARQRKYEAIGRALRQRPKWLPIPGPPGIPLPR